jgi:hypothetical protein
MSEDCVRKVCVYRGEEASNYYTQVKGLWGIVTVGGKGDIIRVKSIGVKQSTESRFAYDWIIKLEVSFNRVSYKDYNIHKNNKINRVLI